MKSRMRSRVILLLIGSASCFSQAQIKNFTHVVLLVQENRTPDNLFQGLCLPPYGNSNACGTGFNQYDIANFGVDNRGNQVKLHEVPLGSKNDPGHSHKNFNNMCHLDSTTNQCRMDGLLSEGCPTKCSFQYVHPADVHQYLELAQRYGWANSMFQTNQGPSAPAHQFLFGGTSARSEADDAQARFVAENTSDRGCLSPLNTVWELIDPGHLDEFDLVNNPLGTVCASRDTMATLLDKHVPSVSWKYYSPSIGIWNAPAWIREICQPDSQYRNCEGTEWKRSLDLNPADVLTDITNCALADVSWVIPTGENSDHPSHSDPAAGGPEWVSSIVNALGKSWEASGHHCDYWGNNSNDTTAIIITWDDWGGFYDHRKPPFLSVPSEGQGDYQYGFRVPMLVVSAYTNPTIDSANQYDFGSILRFIEQNYGLGEGALGLADARSHTDLTSFFNLQQKPLPFVPVASPLGADFFINDKRPMEPPDDD
jgi:phospholipase C